MQVDIDSKIDSRLKDFHDTIKCEIRSELHSLFEQYFSHSSSTSIGGVGMDKGKGVLESPAHGVLPKEQLVLSPLPDLGTTARVSKVNISSKPFRLNCPRFDGVNFRGWWSKLEYFFFWLSVWNIVIRLGW